MGIGREGGMVRGNRREGHRDGREGEERTVIFERADCFGRGVGLLNGVMAATNCD